MAVIGEVSYGELLAKTLPRVIETDALKSLMEDRGIRQRDLLPVFGSSSVASDVLSGKRAVSPNTSAASQPLHLTDSQGAKRALQPAESICPTGLLRSASTSEESD